MIKKRKIKIKIDSLTIGCDPEMFLRDTKTGLFVSGIGLIGGSKEHPLPITKDGHCIQEDNVSVEFNIPPSKNADELVKHIQFVKDYISDTIAKPKGLELAVVPSALFSNDQLDNEKAQTFGCDPDFNAWTMCTNDVNRENVDPALRVAGGHIHVGYENPTDDISMELIKAMDLFLAVPAVLVDTDKRRRQLYGKAGAFRFKKFGVEHRTLSNFWIENPQLIRWVYNNLLAAVEFVNTGYSILNPDDIVNCINNCDKELALKIIDDYRVEVPIFKNEVASLS